MIACNVTQTYDLGFNSIEVKTRNVSKQAVNVYFKFINSVSAVGVANSFRSADIVGYNCNTRHLHIYVGHPQRAGD